MSTRRCVRCGELREESFFSPSNRKTNRAGQPVGVCRDCNTEFQKEWRHRRSQSAKSKVDVEITCGICGVTKNAVEYRWNSRTGYRPDCKECEKTKLRCTGCGEIKPHDLFPVAQKMAIGRHSICKECHKKRINAKYHTDSAYRKRRREYQQSERGKAAHKKNREKPENKTKYREYHRKFTNDQYHSDPVVRNKVKARGAVSFGVQYGFLTRPATCQHPGKYAPQCGGKIEAHHWKGYDRENWLNVEWLCETCHTAADMKTEET